MSLTRNTLFALLTAVESDLRAVVHEVVPEDSLLSDDERRDAGRRWTMDRPRGGSEAGTRELIDYLDLATLLDIALRHAGPIAAHFQLPPQAFRAQVDALRELVPIRNRVCHARPLEPDDLTRTLGGLEVIESSPLGKRLTELARVRRLLESDPTFPLVITIPDFWKRDQVSVYHNLPVPDYDDTGFIGRRADREQVGRLLRGVHPIITVTGEGGVGKTSLAQQCLYDLAIDPAAPFDQIVWITLKTNVLGPAGVRVIAGALQTPDAVLAETARQFGPMPADADFESLVRRVIEYLGTLRVLLAVDNMETIDRDALRPLFLELPRGSKVLLTSRYGIGEFETLYPLSGMERQDAIRLFRTTARLFNADDLWKRDDNGIGLMCERLFFNPLAIRWFVQSYSEGRSAADLIERQRNLKDLLDFCFHTLYEGLSDEYRQYLRILVAIGKPLSEVQLALLAGRQDVEKVKLGLRYLYSSNLLRRVADDWGQGLGSLWTTSDFARAFISTRDKALLGERPKLVGAYRALLQARGKSTDARNMNPFRARAFVVTTTDEATVQGLLQSSLTAANTGEHRRARDSAELATRLTPHYFEAWRVLAQALAAAGDPMGASQAFGKAIELADDRSAALLVHYAVFLAAHDDAFTAYELLKPAASQLDADLRLVASYARMAYLTGELAEALEAFERAEVSLPTLGGRERMIFVTYHCEALAKAATTELQRALPRKAYQHLLHGLDVAASCSDAAVDRVFVRVVQRMIDGACSLVARTCSSPDWELLAVHLTTLHSFLPLRGANAPGVDQLTIACGAISGTAAFQESFGPGVHREVLYGMVDRPAPDRDYVFVKGDDGQDYYLGRTELKSGNWSQLGSQGHSRIRFEPVASPNGKAPRAKHSQIVTLDDSDDLAGFAGF